MQMDEWMLAEYGYFLDLDDLAVVLHMKKTSLYQQIHQGKLDFPRIKRGKKYLFPTLEIAAILMSEIERPKVWGDGKPLPMKTKFEGF